jgi:hypothetical protein
MLTVFGVSIVLYFVKLLCGNRNFWFVHAVVLEAADIVAVVV